MIFFTLQKSEAWEEAQQKGYLTGNIDHINVEWFMESYTWMINQMSKRLKNYNNEYPVWLWLDYRNVSFANIMKGDWVFLEVNIPKEEVLLSNFDAWHVVLNEGHFYDDENVMTKEESWECIFEKDILEKMGYDFDDMDLQGVIGKIDVKDIRVLKCITDMQ